MDGWRRRFVAGVAGLGLVVACGGGEEGGDVPDSTIPPTEIAPAAVLRGHEGWVLAAEFSPDGKWLLTSGNDDVVIVWDVKTGTSAARLDIGALPLDAAMSPSGDIVVVTDIDGRATIWDRASGALVEELALIDPTAPHVPDIANRGIYLPTAQFDQAGTRLVTANVDETAEIWSTAEWSQELSLPAGGAEKQVGFAMFSPDSSSVLVSGDQEIRGLYDAISGEFRTRIGWGHPSLVGPDGNVMRGAVFSPSGARVATSGIDGSLAIWDVATGDSISSENLPYGAPGPTIRMAFVADETQLVAICEPLGMDDRPSWEAMVYDLTTGEFVETVGVMDSDWGRAVAMSDDGSTLVIAPSVDEADEAIEMVEEAMTGTSTPEASTPENGPVEIWDPLEGRLRALLPDHTDQVTAAAISPDTSMVATTSRDGTVRLWDIDQL